MDLTAISVFHGLTPQDIEKIRPALEPVSLRAGETLFREGEPGDALYIVESGALTIAKRVREDSEETIAILTVDRGGFLGELSVLSDIPRSGSAVAAEETTLWRLSKERLLALVRNEPAIGTTLLLNLTRTIAKRVHQVNQELAVLFEVGRVLASGAEHADRTLPEALRILAQGLHADRACLFAVNPVAESLELTASVGVPDSAGPLSVPLKAPSGRLSALLRLEGPRITDIQSLTELSGSSRAQGWESDSNLILPITGAETPAAYLVLGRARPPFASDDLNLAQSASRQLAQFIERARLQQDVKLQRDIKREYFRF